MKTIFPHALYGRGVLVEQWSGTTANASRPNTAPASPSDDADWTSWHNQDNDDAVQPFRTTPSRRIRHTFCHLTPDGSAAKNAKGGNLIIRFPPSSSGGGCEIRTREAVTPTRFPSVRHRPLGESSIVQCRKACNLNRIYQPAISTQVRCVVSGGTGHRPSGITVCTLFRRAGTPIQSICRYCFQKATDSICGAAARYSRERRSACFL